MKRTWLKERRPKRFGAVSLMLLFVTTMIVCSKVSVQALQEIGRRPFSLRQGTRTLSIFSRRNQPNWLSSAGCHTELRESIIFGNQHGAYAPTRLYSIDKGGRGDGRLDRFPEEAQEVLSAVEESLCQDILPQALRSDKADEPTLLLMGVSGGCDSMGLLHALLDISSPSTEQPRSRHFRDGQVVELHVVHFDHKQRGFESDQDCQLVQDFCRDEDIPCHIYQWDNKDAAKFSQDKARQWRQSIMTDMLQELTHQSTRPGLILTAHHANDSQETLLLKLLRGVHVQNLSGMAQIQQMGDYTVWARPLLGLTKEQIQHYLISQNYTWREDASNQSDKYLRNRVRNELIPLMQELVGGEAALQRRLENLEEQCQDIRVDLSGRVEPILKENVDLGNRFLISPKMNFEQDMVARNALYEWASEATNKHQFSHDIWKNVLSQLRDYPENQQWTLPLGGGWQIVRTGEALQVVCERVEGNAHADSRLRQTTPNSEVGEPIPWSYVEESSAPTASHNLVVQPDPSLLHCDEIIETNEGRVVFVKSTSGANINSWKFTPPWRHGRSPLKLGSFLRGQKVPLHLRSVTPIICCHQQDGHDNEEAEPLLVAVWVNDEWIVDATWAATPSEDKDGGAQILLNLSY